MFRNYLTVTLRNLHRHKGYSFINLLGLAIGMACCVIILLYVQDEFRFDRYPQDAENIYRVVLNINTPDRGEIQVARTPPPWGPSLAQDYPEVESYVRFKTPLVSWLVSREEKNLKFHEKGFYFADATVFSFFDLELLQGNPDTALAEPRTLVLTTSAARRYFGDEDPMGHTLRLDNAYDFKVTGVMRDVPRHSHFDFDILASFATLSAVPIYGGPEYATWRNGVGPDLYTYVKLKEGFPPAEFEAKMPGFLENYLGELLPRLNLTLTPQLQPLTRIHLYSRLEAEIHGNSDISYIYIFSAIAIFIMLIACINFMNLATARSARRAQEVGMRKVVGAEKKQLVTQFLGESVIMACFGLMLALVLVVAALPFFNSVSAKALRLNLADPTLVFGMVTITLFVGLVSGSYPALFLSSFQPVAVFRGSLKAGKANARLRKFLVMFQFCLSVIFMIGTSVVYSQLHFVQNKRLGFDKEQVVVLPMGDPRARQVYQTFKDRVISDPDVLALAGTNSVPGGLIGMGLILPEGKQQGEEVAIEQFLVDHDIVQALGLEMAEGRTFSRDFSTDTMEAFLMNETAVRQFGWQDQALGKRIDIGNFKQGRVIGVVKDFHAKSLHQRIEPLLIHIAPDPDPFLQLVVRINTRDVARVLGMLQQRWEEVYPNDPFVYSFLDADFDKLYRSEKQRGRIFLAFSLLAILIACLGLLGLASFTAEQKTKEIGIRKVLGSSVAGIVRLLSSEFVKLVIIANVIAWPVAYLVMHNWLDNFAYRVRIHPLIFLVTTGLALVIALITVSYQALRAALTDPVASIRSE